MAFAYKFPSVQVRLHEGDEVGYRMLEYEWNQFSTWVNAGDIDRATKWWELSFAISYDQAVKQVSQVINAIKENTVLVTPYTVKAENHAN